MDSKLVPHVEIEQEVLGLGKRQEPEETSRRQAMMGRGRHLAEVEKNPEAATGDQPVTAHQLKQWNDATGFPIQLK
jgi:hypothetical protein